MIANGLKTFLLRSCAPFALCSFASFPLALSAQEQAQAPSIEIHMEVLDAVASPSSPSLPPAPGEHPASTQPFTAPAHHPAIKTASAAVHPSPHHKHSAHVDTAPAVKILADNGVARSADKKPDTLKKKRHAHKASTALKPSDLKPAGSKPAASGEPAMPPSLPAQQEPQSAFDEPTRHAPPAAADAPPPAIVAEAAQVPSLPSAPAPAAVTPPPAAPLPAASPPPAKKSGFMSSMGEFLGGPSKASAAPAPSAPVTPTTAAAAAPPPAPSAPATPPLVQMAASDTAKAGDPLLMNVGGNLPSAPSAPPAPPSLPPQGGAAATAPLADLPPSTPPSGNGGMSPPGAPPAPPTPPAVGGETPPAPLADLPPPPPSADPADVKSSGEAQMASALSSPAHPPSAPAAPAPAPAPATSEPTVSGSMLRIPFNETETDVPLTVTGKLDAVANALNSKPGSCVTIMAYAGGPEQSGIYPKRVALARGIAVRNYLTTTKNIDIERVNVKAKGNQSEGGPPDRVDIFVMPKCGG